jgi:hypothetical protein
MTQASARLRPYGTISGAVLTRARLPIARIFGEIRAAKELGLVFVPAGQSQRAKGPVDLRATRKLSQQNHVSDKSASGKSETINALVAINSRIFAIRKLAIKPASRTQGGDQPHPRTLLTVLNQSRSSSVWCWHTGALF